MWSCRLKVTLAVLLSTGMPVAQADPALQHMRPIVVGRMYHDPEAFTEGLFFDGAGLYESTGPLHADGSPAPSQLRELDPTTGRVRRSVDLPPNFFGEGIADAGDRIWQLTYQNGVAIEWDKATFRQLRQVPITGEGWGLCRDGDRLIESDGTGRLRFYSVDDMQETGSVEVTYNGVQGSGLNSLDCIGNQVWANVFPTNEIVRINADTGVAEAVIDATGLLTPQRPAQVLNGIAHLDDTHFLLTGKNWPTMYQVTFG